MTRIQSIAVLVGAAIVSSAPTLVAQPLRVLSLSTESYASDFTPQTAADLSAALHGTDPDLIIISGLPNRTSAQRLTTTLKAPWQLILHGSPGANTNSSARTTTILARRPAFAARVAEWRAAGQVELPGGFAFAGFRSGSNTVCLYAAAFPDDTRSEPPTHPSLSSRKRDLAAQYLLHHIHWLQSTLTNQNVTFALFTDLGLASTGGLETAGRSLQQAGFGAWLAPRAGNDASPSHSLILARNAVLLTTPKPLSNGTEPLHGLIYELGNPRDNTAAPGSVALRAPTTRSSMPAWMWLWLGILASVTALTCAIRFWIRRRATTANYFRPQAAQPILIDVNPSPFTAPTEDTTDDQEDQAGLRAGLFEQLRTLLGERLVAWLAAQRGRLLASQDRGTKLVGELEERLQKVQGHFEEQMKNRDQRILELEREIQAREEMIRRLLLARTGQADLRPPD